MSKVDWEQMRSSLATVGVVRGADFLGKVGKFCFKPMFWEVAQHPDLKLGTAATRQLVRTYATLWIMAITKQDNLLQEVKLGDPFDIRDVLFALSVACSAGAAVDWVGLGLQAVGRKSKGT